MTKPRIQPLNPPYAHEIQESFDRIMPPGVPPLRIFRTFARNPLILRRQMALGGAFLKEGSVDPREREIVIHRTCARCGSEYEWGVHVTAFARPLGFTDAEIDATLLGGADDPAWNARESLLIRLVDELHDTNTVSDGLWESLAQEWSDAQLVELICLAGMYHAVSFLTNAARMELEEDAARFPAARSV